MGVSVKDKAAFEPKNAYPMLLGKTSGFLDWVGNFRDAVIKTTRRLLFLLC
jgi:hypothetical protein